MQLIILDFEASSLSDGSYPISVGVIVNGEARYWLIKPRTGWIDWSLESQAIHGIKRSSLLEHGIDVSVVYYELKTLLGGAPVIYSDNPYWESRWLRCLGKFDCEVRHIHELLPASAQLSWAVCLDHQFKLQRLTRHRADHDAYAIHLALAAMLGN